MTTANVLSDNELTTESCQRPRSLETCVSSYSPVPLGSTEDLQTWLQQAFPVNPSPSPESSEAQTMTAICGQPLLNASARYDHDMRSWKMSQGWLLADISEPSLETWQKAGLIVAGEYYPQPKWARRISEIGSGLLPTPTDVSKGGGSSRSGDRINETPTLQGMARKGQWPTPRSQDSKHGAATEWELQSGRGNLHIAVAKAMWPTPSASDVTGGPGNSGREGGLNLRTAVKQWATPTVNGNYNRKGCSDTSGDGLATQVGGQLSPDWVEWLMNWPIGWTSLEPLAPEAWQQWLDTALHTWWVEEPPIPRVASGVRHRVDRLKAIGNGQVSVVASVAWQLLTEDLCNH